MMAAAACPLGGPRLLGAAARNACQTAESCLSCAPTLHPNWERNR